MCARTPNIIIQFFSNRILHNHFIHALIWKKTSVRSHELSCGFILFSSTDVKGLRHLHLDNTDEYDTKLLSSAVKKYLRILNEPLMTFDLHDKFIAAASKLI